MAKSTVETTETPQAAEALKQMSSEQLLQVILGMQQQMVEQAKAQGDANKNLVEAILESRKPYVDPNKDANDELFRELDRKQRERERATTEFIQKNCKHIAGSSNLSEQPDLYGRTSIVWHRGDVGQSFGICTTCGRQFHQDDPDYAEWRSKRSFNKESRAGERFVADPIGAQKKSRLAR